MMAVVEHTESTIRWEGESADVLVIGAGAAGLFAALWCGREMRARGQRGRVVAVDGAKKLGAKILVAGGGRCNVTHQTVEATAYAGSTAPAIKNVLRQFDVGATVAFFQELGVELKREETGKLFPVSDDARTVLDALLRAAKDAGVEIVHPWRVGGLTRSAGEDWFVAQREGAGESGPGEIRARRVVLATGGKSLPKTGSDGAGYALATGLGHSVTAMVVPALVPLMLPREHWLCALSGLTMEATIELRSGSGKKLRTFTNSTLLTHFGLSGPSVLDMSRYYTHQLREEAGARLVLNFLPGQTMEGVDRSLEASGRGGRVSVVRWLIDAGLYERLARAMCTQLGMDSGASVGGLTREARRGLAEMLTQTVLPVTGDRGWIFAEVTAGGVPLREVRLEDMESRCCPGLHLCGEILDVDGRIGGFNFQWAWASGYVAGRGAGRGGAVREEG